jgi:hypothetical protein
MISGISASSAAVGPEGVINVGVEVTGDATAGVVELDGPVAPGPCVEFQEICGENKTQAGLTSLCE